LVSAHFYGGQTRYFGNYSIVFVPSPDPPVATDNKTRINFSVLEFGDNIYNIAAAATLKEKNSGATVLQTSYRPYEFSDISIPMVFPKPGDYTVSLETKIPSDSNSSETPLVASFNVSAMDPNMPVPLDELMLLYVTPTAVVIGGIVVYMHSRGKI
jgi:hypothetical protein